MRDHIGICPLYIGWGADGSVWFASEFKALVDTCTRFEPFPPGHVYDRCGEHHPLTLIVPQAQNWRAGVCVRACADVYPCVSMCIHVCPCMGLMYCWMRSTTKEITRWFRPTWVNREMVPTEKVDLAQIRERLTAAVAKRLMGDVPWGVLLSGGLDSSLIASIASRHVSMYGTCDIQDGVSSIQRTTCFHTSR